MEQVLPFVPTELTEDVADPLMNFNDEKIPRDDASEDSPRGFEVTNRANSRAASATNNAITGGPHQVIIMYLNMLLVPSNLTF